MAGPGCSADLNSKPGCGVRVGMDVFLLLPPACLMVDHQERSLRLALESLVRRVARRATLACWRMSLQRRVAAEAVCRAAVDFCRLAVAQALSFAFMASVHSGVYQAGSVGRDVSCRDGMKRDIPWRITSVMLAHDSSALVVKAVDQS